MSDHNRSITQRTSTKTVTVSAGDTITSSEDLTISGGTTIDINSGTTLDIATGTDFAVDCESTITLQSKNDINVYTDSAQGGGFDLQLGSGISTGNGGTVSIEAGAGGSSSGNGGALTLNAGDASAGNSTGGATTITTGDGSGSSDAGAMSLTGGVGGATGDGGDLVLTGGAGGSSSGAGGSIDLFGGSADGSGSGGYVNVQAGNGVSGAAGTATLKGGSGSGTDQNGGNTILQSGDATGDGSSFVRLLAVDGSQGSGSSTRSAAEYLECDGANKRVTMARPTTITTASGYTEPGLSIDSSTGGGAALNVVSQSTPTSSSGDMWRSSRSGSLLYDDGYNTRPAQIPTKHVRQSPSDTLSIGSGAGETAHSTAFSFPANTLGYSDNLTSIRVKAWGYAPNNATNNSVHIRIGNFGYEDAASGVIVAFITSFGPNCNWVLEGEILINGADGSASFISYGKGYNSVDKDAQITVSNTSIDTTVPQNIYVTFSAGDAAETNTLYGLIVEY